MDVLDLLAEPLNLCIHRSDAETCGWGTGILDNQKIDEFNNIEYSENLHCLIVKIRSSKFCRDISINGQFGTKITCAKTMTTKQLTNLVITFKMYAFTYTLKTLLNLIKPFFLTNQDLWFTQMGFGSNQLECLFD